MLLAVVAACAGETVEVPGETVVVKEEVIKEVQVPGETVVVEKEVIKEVMVPGETVTKEVIKEVEVPGETVVVKEGGRQDRRGPWRDGGGGESGRERGAGEEVCDRPHYR